MRSEACVARGPPRGPSAAQVPAIHSLDFGRDFEAPHARGRELPGVDVGDLLQGAVDVPDVVTFHHQDGLRGVEVILENSRRYHRREWPTRNPVPGDPPSPWEGHEASTAHLPQQQLCAQKAVLTPPGGLQDPAL